MKNLNDIGYGNYEKVLLQVCCAPDLTYPLLYLRGRHYKVIGFFYNPNIHPKSEYEKRLLEARKVAKINGMELIEWKYDNSEVKKWFNYVRDFYKEPEGGKRCHLCYKLRLEETAKVAKEKGFDYFTSTITISPHKNSNWVFEIAGELEKTFGVKFLYANFKKRNGFKASIILSRFYGLYRQNYCGCIFSKFDTRNQ